LLKRRARERERERERESSSSSSSSSGMRSIGGVSECVCECVSDTDPCELDKPRLSVLSRLCR